MNVVGLFWNKNEADILAQTIEAALPHVDTLFIADDESSDASWDIIRAYHVTHKDKIEHIQQLPNKQDPGQRQSLLNIIRSRYKPEDTWVQIIESDIMILDTDVREAIKKHARYDVAVSWQALNGVRKPGTWDEVDAYPHWGLKLQELMPFAHRMEYMLYTFRPLPHLEFNRNMWRPWPQGFSKCGGPIKVDSRTEDAPLLAHYGYRGPTHFLHKYGHMGDRHTRYTTWDLTSKEAVLNTVSFFNGDWNSRTFDMSREGWVSYRRGRKQNENK